MKYLLELIKSLFRRNSRPPHIHAKETAGAPDEDAKTQQEYEPSDYMTDCMSANCIGWPIHDPFIGPFSW